jgi:hypothetical protein
MPVGAKADDGTRIVCSEERTILIIDIATGKVSAVAEGSGAIWLDPHRLLTVA